MLSVTISGVEVKLDKSAVIPIFYNKYFHRDLTKDFRAVEDEDNEAEAINTITRLTYTMHKHAGGLKGLNEGSYEDYINWMMAFGAWDFYDENVIKSIIEFYVSGVVVGNGEDSSEAETGKKTDAKTKKKEK